MDSGGMPEDWRPPEPNAVGSKAWLNDMAFKFMVEAYNGLPRRSGVFKLPKVEAGGVRYSMGYFVLLHSAGGSDYFRADSIETVSVKPTFRNCTATT